MTVRPLDGGETYETTFTVSPAEQARDPGEVKTYRGHRFRLHAVYEPKLSARVDVDGFPLWAENTKKQFYVSAVSLRLGDAKLWSVRSDSGDAG
ncbi:hypothetical protein FRC20_006246 [Serendipita sp. 405]|nr:hypothetical protein FRC20_006246 [Serendipita sp. 405]